MSLIPGKSLRSLGLVAALFGLVACVENNGDAGLILLRNTAPEEDCVLDTSTSMFLNGGIIQSNSPVGYIFTPLIRNDLVVADEEATAPKTVFLEGARVELSFYDSGLFSETELTSLESRGLTEFMVPLSGAVDPGGGLAVLSFEIVPQALLFEIGQALPAASEANPTPSTVLDARIQMFGSRGGGDIDSNWFRYPVEVCRDCLTVVVNSCDALSDSFDPRTGGVCNPRQDGFLDCCSTDEGVVCPATPSEASDL